MVSSAQLANRRVILYKQNRTEFRKVKGSGISKRKDILSWAPYRALRSGTTCRIVTLLRTNMELAIGSRSGLSSSIFARTIWPNACFGAELPCRSDQGRLFQLMGGSKHFRSPNTAATALPTEPSKSDCASPPSHREPSMPTSSFAAMPKESDSGRSLLTRGHAGRIWHSDHGPFNKPLSDQ